MSNVVSGGACEKGDIRAQKQRPRFLGAALLRDGLEDLERRKRSHRLRRDALDAMKSSEAKCLAGDPDTQDRS